MFAELSIATLMVILTVTIHGAGLVTLARILRLEAREEAAARIDALSLRGVVATLLVILGLFALHGAEIWAYAFLYDASARCRASGNRSIFRPSPTRDRL